jgi:hypothetical protein
VEVLAVHVSVAVCWIGCTPEPLSEILAGEFVALLDTVTRPVALPDPEGVNVTFRVADCPGFSVNPDETPPAL